jgi:hypothetical protein
MRRNYAWALCTMFCTVFCAATSGRARAACWSSPAPRSTYAIAAPAPYPTVMTYYQPGAVPSVQPQPACCGHCAPQIVQQPVVQQPVAPPPYVAYRPILPLAPVPETYYTGQGVLGQPKLYVPGQPIRNFLRYLGP